MSRYKIIGIIGRKQSGKNTIASILNYLKIHNITNSNELINEEEFKNFDKIKLKGINSKFPFYHQNSDMFYKIESFAYPIKLIVCNMTDTSLKKLDDEKYKNTKSPIKGFTYRELMTTIGSKFRDMFGENVWVNILEKTRINKIPNNYVISDVRFPNEVEMLKKHNALLIKVIKPGLEKGNDISETSVDLCNDYHHLIHNDGSLLDLIFKVREIMIKEQLINEY